MRMRKSIKKAVKKVAVSKTKARGSDAKTKPLELQVRSQEKELQSLKKLLAQRETELNQLRDQIKYKNQQLASKDIEMDSYRKVTEERIFQLGAKIKEYEARMGRRSTD
jgi:peptidoglycan hydrolase CwlO-like protein